LTFRQGWGELGVENSTINHVINAGMAVTIKKLSLIAAARGPGRQEHSLRTRSKKFSKKGDLRGGEL